MDIPSFLAGAGLASMACAVIHWASVGATRREDARWRAEQRQRIDDLAARSEANYDKSRKELGLPPRIRS